MICAAPRSPVLPKFLPQVNLSNIAWLSLPPPLPHFHIIILHVLISYGIFVLLRLSRFRDREILPSCFALRQVLHPRIFAWLDRSP